MTTDPRGVPFTQRRAKATATKQDIHYSGIITPENHYWVHTVIMAGLNRMRETQQGDKIETYGDLYDESDRIMRLIFEGEGRC